MINYNIFYNLNDNRWKHLRFLYFLFLLVRTSFNHFPLIWNKKWFVKDLTFFLNPVSNWTSWACFRFFFWTLYLIELAIPEKISTQDWNLECLHLKPFFSILMSGRIFIRGGGKKLCPFPTVVCIDCWKIWQCTAWH